MMKKFRYIGLMMGLVILFSSNTQAQYYYTSYGYAHEWYLPKYVQYAVYDNYYGYEIAHVKRNNKHGQTNFNVLLHKNGWFVELRFDQHGHIYKTIRHKWHYPLNSHMCSSHCGYHHNYYKVYYPKYHKKPNYHGQKHHTTVYVETDDHGKKHGKGHKQHNTYYTNVYVEKQHKGNDRYSQQQKQVNSDNQRESSRGTIRIPDASSKKQDNARRTSEYRNSTTVQRGNTVERYTRPTSNTNSSARATANREGSRTSRQR